jgi:type IV secretion system protein VirB10
LIGGIVSDLPGQILGQVSENVYDSASGRFILVPHVISNEKVTQAAT